MDVLPATLALLLDMLVQTTTPSVPVVEIVLGLPVGFLVRGWGEARRKSLLVRGELLVLGTGRVSFCGWRLRVGSLTTSKNHRD